MPKVSKNAPQSEKDERMKEEMDKYGEGRLHSGSKSGPIVRKHSQAVAIALSESGQSKDGKRKKSRKKSRKSGRR